MAKGLAGSRNAPGFAAHLHPSRRCEEDGTARVAAACQGGELGPGDHRTITSYLSRDRTDSCLQPPHITRHRSPTTTAEPGALHIQLGRQGIPAPVMSWTYCLSPWALGCEEVSSGGVAT